MRSQTALANVDPGETVDFTPQPDTVAFIGNLIRIVTAAIDAWIDDPDYSADDDGLAGAADSTHPRPDEVAAPDSSWYVIDTDICADMNANSSNAGCAKSLSAPAASGNGGAGSIR